MVLDILTVLIRLARHSLESATRVRDRRPGTGQRASLGLALPLSRPHPFSSWPSQVLECPRLVETVVREFLPTSWSPMGSGPTSSLHRVPCAPAMKLLRVLASAGRNIAARLVSRTQGRRWWLGWGLSVALALLGSPVMPSFSSELFQLLKNATETPRKEPRVSCRLALRSLGRLPVPCTQARRATYISAPSSLAKVPSKCLLTRRQAGGQKGGMDHPSPEL